MKTLLLYLFSALFFWNPLSLWSQTKVTKFRFIEYERKDDSLFSSSHYLDDYTRIYYKDGSFRERGLFSKVALSKYKTSDWFKVRQGYWFIEVNGKWEVFFNMGKPVNTIIYVNGIKFKIIWNKTAFLDRNNLIYQLELKPIGVFISGLSRFYFTASDGVIAMNGHDYFLVRTDKKYLVLQ